MFKFWGAQLTLLFSHSGQTLVAGLKMGRQINGLQYLKVVGRAILLKVKRGTPMEGASVDHVTYRDQYRWRFRNRSLAES